MNLHTCEATGCQHQVPKRMLMCVDHWRMVPTALRAAVLMALGKFNRVRHGPQGPALDALRAYREAVAAAVAAVAMKQKNKTEAQAGFSGDLFDQVATPARLSKEQHGNATKQHQPK